MIGVVIGVIGVMIGVAGVVVIVGEPVCVGVVAFIAGEGLVAGAELSGAPSGISHR